MSGNEWNSNVPKWFVSLAKLGKVSYGESDVDYMSLKRIEMFLIFFNLLAILKVDFPKISLDFCQSRPDLK